MEGWERKNWGRPRRKGERGTNVHATFRELELLSDAREPEV